MDMTERSRQHDQSGSDRPDTLQCPSCGEPTDRRIMGAGVLFVCENTDCSSLIYQGELTSGRPVKD